MIVMVGTKFGGLSVTDRSRMVRYKSGCTKREWECRCDCGKACYVLASHLLSGHTLSCGCRRVQLCLSRSTHGSTKTPEYLIWASMIQRCTNPKNKAYKNYGGRGIKVCEEWRSFESFHAAMGDRPAPHLTLERKDNEAGYFPDNCEWATRLAQRHNRRDYIARHGAL